MKSGLSLRAYLVSLVLGVTLPLVALLGFYVYRDAASSAKRAAAAVSLIAARTANHVSRFLTDNNLGLEILERQQALRLLDPVHCRSAMHDFIASNPHYANAVVRDRTGNLVCAARHDTQVPRVSPDREAFEQVIREGRFVVSKPYLGRSTGRWVLLLWQPVNDDKGRVMGVIIAGIDLVNFKFTNTDPDTPARTMTRIVDADGTIIASSYDPGHWVGRNARDAASVRLMLAQKQGEARAVGIDGSERIFGFTSIPGTDWLVSSGVPVEVVFDGMRRDLLRIMLATAVILALISVFSHRFMRAITAPMESIATTADAVAAGDLDARAKSGGPRELTAIATQFNAMLDSQILTYRQLRESEKGLRQRALIFESATDAIMILDLQRRILDWNPASERLLGYRKDEVLGKTTEFLYRPGDYAKYVPIINEAFARGEHWVMERVMLRKDGTERICETIRAPLLDAGGTLIGRIGLTRDITERRQAEETRARLAAIVENSNDAIIGRGLDRTIISWNAAAERLLGYTAAEAIGRDLTGNFPPELRQEAMEIRRLAATGVPVPYFETVRMTKDGRRIDVWHSVSPIKDSNGNVIGTAAIIRDITERKQAEETRARLAAIVENSNDAIIGHGRDRTIISWNAAAERILGYTAAEAIGRDLTGNYPPELRQEAMEIRRLAATGVSVPYFETVRMTKDGRRIDVGLSIFPIRDSNGNVIGTAAIFRDITERKRAEEALRVREHLMRLVTENVPAMIAYFDTELICRFANTAFCEFHRLNPQGVIGKTLREIAGEDTYRVIRPSIYLVKEGKPTLLHRQERTATGGIRHIEIHRVPDMSPEGAYRGHYAMLLDITERRQAEQALQAAHARLRDLTAHMQSAIESERARIARDIHDSLGGALTGISMDLSWCIKQLKPARVKRDILYRLRVLAGQAGDAMQEVRRIITDLRPSILDHLGLWAALDWLAQDFAERNGVPCRRTIHADTHRIDVPPDCATAVFRIVQEALANVARHAYAANVMIRIDNEGDELVIKVIDDGKGVTTERFASPGSYGILGMQERALIFGGSVKVTGVRAVGTSVELRLPLAGAPVTKEG